MTEDEVVGWHHRLDGHEFEQAPGVGWWTGKPGVLQAMGLPSRTWLSDWTELNWNNPEYWMERLMLKLQYFGHLMYRANALEKTLMLWKIEGKRRRGWQRMRWVNTITNSMDMNLSKLWEMAKDWGIWCAVVHGVPKSQTQHNDWTTTINNTATLFEQIKSDHFQEQSDLKILSCFKATQTTKSKLKVRGPPAQWSSPGLSTKI